MATRFKDPLVKPDPNHPGYCLQCPMVQLKNFPPMRNHHPLAVCSIHIKPYWYGYRIQHWTCLSCLRKYFLPWEEFCSNCFKTEYPNEHYLSLTKVRNFFLNGEVIPLVAALDSYHDRRMDLIMNHPSL